MAATPKRRGLPTLYVDFLFLTLLAFILLVNPPTEQSDRAPGNISVQIAWPEGDIDVDLWLFGPGQAKPVGWSNRGSNLFNLLRDDVGNANDRLKLNYENAYSRGVPDGEYIINVHCYRCGGATPVDVEIRKTSGTGQQTLLFTELVNLVGKEELTVVRFRLDKDGNLIPGSANRVNKSLRHGV
jgi:hypothetical protein